MSHRSLNRRVVLRSERFSITAVSGKIAIVICGCRLASSLMGLSSNTRPLGSSAGEPRRKRSQISSAGQCVYRTNSHKTVFDLLSGPTSGSRSRQRANLPTSATVEMRVRGFVEVANGPRCRAVRSLFCCCWDERTRRSQGLHSFSSTITPQSDAKRLGPRDP